jgi:hypothetical protein
LEQDNTPILNFKIELVFDKLEKIKNHVGPTRQPHCPDVDAQTAPMMSQLWPPLLFSAHGSAATPPGFHRLWWL